MPESAPPRLTAIEKGLLLFNVLFACLAASLLWRMGWLEVREAEQQTMEDARLLERNVSELLDAASLALRVLSDTVAPSHPDTSRGVVSPDALRQDLLRRFPQVQSIELFDETGVARCPGAPTTVCRAAPIGNEGYFLRARAQPGMGSTLVEPARNSLAVDPALTLIQPLQDRDGRFAGLARVQMPWAQLQEVIRPIRHGAAGVVSLRWTNLQFLVREPPLPTVTQPDNASPTLLRLLQTQPAAGTYRAINPLDGVERINAYVRAPGWPLYVLVGYALDDVLGAWHTTSLMTAAFMAVVVIASMLLAAALRREQRQQARATALYDTAPCGYHALDAHGRFLRINQTELAWLGASRAEVIGRRSPRDFFSADSQRTFDANFPKLASEGALTDLELDLIGRDGTQRRVLVNAQRLQDERGRFIGSNSVMHDITRLHQARQTIRQLLDRQSAILGSSPVGLATVTEGRIVWANPAMSALLGLPQDQLAGLSVAPLLADPERAHDLDQLLGAAAGQPDTPRLEAQLRLADGGRRWVDIHCTRLETRPDEWLLTLTDLEDKKAAEALRQHQFELHALNAQLLETSQLKSTFLSNMSHELRTPLNAILGFAELATLLPDDGPRAPLKAYAQHILKAGRHLQSLIQTQLDFALAESGKMVLAHDIVGVATAMREAIALLDEPAQAARIRLTLSCSEALACVHVDHHRLTQLVAELIGNAIKFSAPDGLVEVRTLTAGDDRWAVEVQDHGEGIAEADRERIFMPFVQLSSGPAKRHEGLGLGLALARKLARAMGGDITLRSEVGAGSVFRLELPVLA